MELTLESLNVLDPFEIPQEYEPCKFSENPILNDLIDKDASPDNAFYTPETIQFALTIKEISPKAYEYIRKKIPFPSPYLCNKAISENANL